jgi:hypothetical protein
MTHPEFRRKLEAIGFGVFIPVSFITSGVKFDLDALTSSSSSLVMVPIFLAALLMVRGLPAVLYHRLIGTRRTVSAGLMHASLALFEMAKGPSFHLDVTASTGQRLESLVRLFREVAREDEDDARRGIRVGGPVERFLALGPVDATRVVLCLEDERMVTRRDDGVRSAVRRHHPPRLGVLTCDEGLHQPLEALASHA